MMKKSVRLVSDIGGTHARFAWNDGDDLALRDPVRVQCAEAGSVSEAIRGYLAAHDVPPPVSACLAVAGPVGDDRIALTNGPWVFSRRSLEVELGLDALEVMNDFAAQACALTVLGDGDTASIGDVASRGAGTRVVLGPGTGLGVAAAVPGTDRWTVVSGEGGHTSFAPVDDLERRVADRIGRLHGRVSNERLLSGSGLAEIHRALATIEGVAPEVHGAAEITAGALSDASSLCRRTVDFFLDVLASVSGDVALLFGATGGVHIAGGIVPRVASLIEPARFRRRFADKGRMSAYAERISTHLVTTPHSGLLGALARLDGCC